MAESPTASATTSAPAAAAATAPLTLPLRKPIVAYGDEVSTLAFREPTAADIIACGDPVSFDFSVDPPRTIIEPKAMSAMIATLATVPASSVAKMHPKDWKNAAWTLAGFFTPDLGGGGTT